MRRTVHVWAPGFSGFGGGITAFSRELAVGLQERGAIIQLLGKADSDGQWNGLPLVGGGSRTAVFAGKGVLASTRGRPEWIVSTHLNFGPAVRWAARLGGSRYALVAHGIDVHSALSVARLKAIRHADQLIVVSQWTRQRLLDIGGIEAKRIEILPNTYDDKRFLPGPYPEALAARYGIRPSERVILTVARLEPGEGYKGYDRILEALPQICRAAGEVRFVIAGKGGDRGRLEEMASDFGVSEHVTFAGFVPDEELADHYRLADVFAMPSTGEGFGIVFLEAMGCGTPVLGGNQDGSVDALDGGKLGLLVDPTSVDAIAEGLIELLRRQGRDFWFDRQRLSAVVKERYGREAFRRRVAEIFGLGAGVRMTEGSAMERRL